MSFSDYQYKFIYLTKSYLLLYIWSFVEDPLVGSIAQQYVNDRQQHDKIAKEWTRRYATWSNEKEELRCIKNFLDSFCWSLKLWSLISWHLSIIQHKVFSLFQNHKEKKQKKWEKSKVRNHAEKKNKEAIS